MSRIWKNGTVASATLLVVLFFIGLLAGGNANKNVAEPSPLPTVSQDAEGEVALEDLTVNLSDLVPDALKCASNEFNDASLSQDKKWSDAVSVPASGNTAEEKFEDIKKELCGNPTLLLMTIEGLSSVKIQGDTTIGDVNPWMAEFISAAKEDVFSLLTKKSGEGEKVFVTAEYTKVAEATLVVLSKLNLTGIVEAKSATNWHISPENGLVADKLPIATLNEKQYKGEFIRLEYSYKDGRCSGIVLGFNTEDKRFVTLNPGCDNPGKPGKPDDPPPPPPPGKDIRVCLLGQESIVWVTIDEKLFNPNKHSFNKSDCVKKKSSDPDDYEYPDDKPTVPPVTEKPEATPPPVETERPGGGGVVDKPSNPPGSETGVPAPGATPAPTTPRPTPSNQGGEEVNSPGDPGGF